MIQPTTFANSDEVKALMRPLYETKRDFDQSDQCVVCQGNVLHSGKVCRVCRGTGWRVRWTEAPTTKPKPPRKTFRPHVKFSEETVAAIKATNEQTMNGWRQLAAQHGMSVSNVRKILKGEGRR